MCCITMCYTRLLFEFALSVRVRIRFIMRYRTPTCIGIRDQSIARDTSRISCDIIPFQSRTTFCRRYLAICFVARTRTSIINVRYAGVAATWTPYKKKIQKRGCYEA